ncbi:MAG: Alpha-monoglucosyldiacylglycerol synthase [Candidatus Heimdallarchaeota archaeon LC_3]|nr:MAG: Alpha-monoglucosyldiacylglycerol synthase [Candidatus Heimdallarchaeota archaeon LC_3]
MRIGIFSDTWLPNINGVSFSVLNQLKALHKEHELFLFVPKTFEDKFEKIPDSVKVFEFSGVIFPPYPGYVMSFPPVRSLKKIMKSQRLDLIHTHTPFLQGWNGLFYRKMQNTPIVSTFHTHIVEYLGHLLAGIAEDKVKRLLGEPAWYLIRGYYNKHHAVITPSAIMKQELEEHGLKNVRSVPNPISPLFFEKHDKMKIQAKKFRKKFSIPSNAKIIMYVGRIAFEKRLEVLLKAYKNLKKEYPDFFLAIVGDGPQFSMYKEKAAKMKLIDYVFTGYIHHSQLPAVYHAGDIFVSPSNTETQGLTFIEAMSQGLPVLGVRSRGVSDSVIHKKNGYLTEKLISLEFETLIKYIFDHPEEVSTINKEAKQTASLFSYDGYRKRLTSAYSLAIMNWKKKNI